MVSRISNRLCPVGKEGKRLFIIMVYDVGQKRVGKVLKTARKYLYWVQNSVLEGDINESSFKKLKLELSKIIDGLRFGYFLYIQNNKVF